MGNINDKFSSKDISFTNLERLINYILSNEKTKSQNINILKEIGLAKQYNYLLDNKISTEIKYVSKNQKTIINYINNTKAKSYFVKWTNILFDINEQEYDVYPNYNGRIKNLRDIPLSKSFFQNNIKKNLIENKYNIKMLKFGIPKYLREFIWEIIIAEKYSNKKYFDREEEQKEYNLFLESIDYNKINLQIKKDLTRTFPDIVNQNDNKIIFLKNLLIYASSLTKDGYCQGMNFVIGFLLQLTNFDEIKSYYFIKHIFPEIKGYFEQDFHILKNNINIFCKFFNKLYPKLYTHFTKNDVFTQFWVGKWFLTLFTLNLPFDELCYIWDLFLIKGFDFSIFISLAIIHYLEKYLINLSDSTDILSYLKKALYPEPNDSINIKKIGDDNKYIIQLNKIFTKALEIENEIINNKELNEIMNKKKNEDIESICSIKTKETETSFINKGFYINNNSYSSKSSNSLRSSLLPKRNNNNKQEKINQFNIDNKTNIIINSKNNNVNINNNINYFNNKKNSCLYERTNKKVFHLFDNIDLTQRRSNNLNVNNHFYCSFKNCYTFTPVIRYNYVYLHNTLLTNNNGAPYTNFVIYNPI